MKSSTAATASSAVTRVGSGDDDDGALAATTARLTSVASASASPSSASASFFLPEVAKPAFPPTTAASPPRRSHSGVDYDATADRARDPTVLGNNRSGDGGFGHSHHHHQHRHARGNNSDFMTIARPAEVHPTQYLSIGIHFHLELLARQTLAREVILYRHAPGDKAATVVGVFCCRPQLELYSDAGIGDTLVGRVVSSGVAVNIAPELPTETNACRLAMPIHCTGRRTLVVGAVLLQQRACGGCFSAQEEQAVAAWCELAAHIVQPPALLRATSAVASGSGLSGSVTVGAATQVPTSLLHAVDAYLPKRGRVVANIGCGGRPPTERERAASAVGASSSPLGGGGGSTGHGAVSFPALAAASASSASPARGAGMGSSTAHHHNGNPSSVLANHSPSQVNELALFDAFANEYRTAPWSAITLLEAVNKNFRARFDAMRADRIATAKSGRAAIGCCPPRLPGRRS